MSECLGVELGPVLTLVEEKQEERSLSTEGGSVRREDIYGPEYLNSIIIIVCCVSAVFELYTDNSKNHTRKY